MMPPEEIEDLAASIKTSGQRHDIKQTSAGLIVDGRNRLAACIAAGVEPRIVTIDESEDIAELILDENNRRRHQSHGARVMSAVLTQIHANDGSKLSAAQRSDVMEKMKANKGDIAMAVRIAMSDDATLIEDVRSGQISLRDGYDRARGIDSRAARKQKQKEKVEAAINAKIGELKVGGAPDNVDSTRATGDDSKSGPVTVDSFVESTPRQQRGTAAEPPRTPTMDTLSWAVAQTAIFKRLTVDDQSVDDLSSEQAQRFHDEVRDNLRAVNEWGDDVLTRLSQRAQSTTTEKTTAAKPTQKKVAPKKSTRKSPQPRAAKKTAKAAKKSGTKATKKTATKSTKSS
ncbi:ParB/RepB/Spo0J family partition protein [Haloglycomyces albus]|uniref:ParB/RepB/Spo0J family partition protein n=1 Tax=Haloglycomyces albus TaxID=526067 RepID=UPI00146FAB1C|nr:ParB N-terminal domain-containing protein [Haloglycomyces albus]